MHLNKRANWEAMMSRKMYGRGGQSSTLETRGQSRKVICKTKRQNVGKCIGEEASLELLKPEANLERSSANVDQ